MKRSLILLMLCSLTRGQEADGCCDPLPEAPFCGCTFHDGRVIDLRSDGNQDGSPKFSTKIQGDSYVYYNPCYPFTIPSAIGCANVALCMETLTQSYSLGIQNTTKFVTINGNNVTIIYSGGTDGRSAEVSLRCDNSPLGNNFSFVEETAIHHYKFTLTDPAFCFINPKDGGLFNSRYTDFDLSTSCVRAFSSTKNPSPTSVPSTSISTTSMTTVTSMQTVSSSLQPSPTSSKYTHHTSGYRLYIIIGTVGGIGLVVVVVIVMIFYIRRRRKRDYRHLNGDNRKLNVDINNSIRPDYVFDT